IAIASPAWYAELTRGINVFRLELKDADAPREEDISCKSQHPWSLASTSSSRRRSSLRTSTAQRSSIATCSVPPYCERGSRRFLGWGISGSPSTSAEDRLTTSPT